MWSRKASVGAFLVGGTVLFGLGLFLIGSRQKVFSRGFRVYAEFAAVSGLEIGADVQVSGLEAGEVEDIQVPAQPSSPYRVKMRLTEKVHPLVRDDSVAVIRTEGLVGNKYVEIEKGSDQKEEAKQESTIPSKENLDFEDLMQTANSTLASVGRTADRAGQAIGTFLATDKQGQNGAEDLKDTVASANRAMNNLAEDTEALKHNFFLRGFFHRRGYYDLNELTPEKYRSSKFVKDKSAKRAWLGAEIFAPGKRGLELSARGKSEVDSAMAGFVESLPNRPVMVEGYSKAGSSDEQFRVSQERAIAVRQYLELRFKLAENSVGAIPLKEKPPDSTGKDQWDGVALVLLP